MLTCCCCDTSAEVISEASVFCVCVFCGRSLRFASAGRKPIVLAYHFVPSLEKLNSSVWWKCPKKASKVRVLLQLQRKKTILFRTAWRRHRSLRVFFFLNGARYFAHSDTVIDGSWFFSFALLFFGASGVFFWNFNCCIVSICAPTSE